jgi:hypothetical protein
VTAEIVLSMPFQRSCTLQPSALAAIEGHSNIEATKNAGLTRAAMDRPVAMGRRETSASRRIALNHPTLHPLAAAHNAKFQWQIAARARKKKFC